MVKFINSFLKYFEPEEEAIYFNQLKSNFFIRLIIIAIILISVYLASELIIANEIFTISALSRLTSIAFLVISLFVLKKLGIKIAGNVLTSCGLIILLIFINIIPKDIGSSYKFIQGFYSVFAYIILGVIFATRPFLIINSSLILISTTHVLIKTIPYHPEEVNRFTLAFINHTIIIIVGTAIAYYANKLIMLAINKAEEEINYREQQNNELLTSEEEIRAANEELVTTTDALVETNEELEHALKRAKESDDLKMEFLNNMSHEVRTPMNGIIGFSQLLNDDELNKITLNNYTNIIQRSSKQLLSIIDNIIEISKLGTRQVSIVKSEINLNEFLNNLHTVFEIKANEQSIGFELKKGLTDAESNIMIDELKLYSTFSNLLENSLKFTTEGSVKISYTLIEKDKKQFLHFTVSDTGIGIDSDKQQYIFEKFRQVNPDLSRQFGGLGLGLTIAKENVQLMGGEINVESEPEKGSIFNVILPLKKA